jgi:3-hydroxyisobutyrate dehydrogenase
MTTVAVLGTGIMGAPMARHLAAAGFDVRAWNRTIEKAQPLADDGVQVMSSPAEAARGADVLLTMLADADVIEQTVTPQLLRDLAGDAVWVQSSTVGIAGTARLSALAAAAGTAYVDAPVLGTRQPAEAASLTVLASGPDALRDRCAPLFDAYAARMLWVGDGDRATRLKLVMNSWVLALTTATAEAMALADGLGLDPKRFLETIEGGPLDVAYAHAKGAMMLKRDFPPAFPVWGGLKDAELILEAAEAAGVRMQVAAGVRAQMRSTLEAGHADEDMAAVWYAVTADRP